MTMSRDPISTQIRATLGAAFEQIRLARAAELARSSRLLEAAAILAPDGRLPENPQGLDMLARIAVRLQDFDTAQCCWRNASQMEPGNPAYAECLGELQLARRKERLRRKVVVGLSTVATIGGLLAAGYILWKQIAGPRESTPISRPAPTLSLPQKTAPAKS